MVNSCGRRDRLCALLIAIVCGGVGFTTLGDWAVLTPDSFGYLGVARSLAETGGFPDRALTLPPGLSMLMAPMMWIGDAPLLWLRLLLVAGWAAGAILTFAYYRLEFEWRWALAAALIVATCPAFLTQSASLLSELVFVPFVMGALIVMRSWRAAERLRKSRVLLGGALVMSAILIRTMGVAMIPVAILVLLTRRSLSWKRRAAMCGLFLLLPVIVQTGWSLRNAGYDRGGGYRRQLTSPRPGEAADAGPIALQWHRLTRHGPERLGTILEAVIPNRLAWRLFQPPLYRPARWLIGGGLLALCAVRLVRRRSVADGFALVLFGILAIWPWNEGPRFVLPMVPVFAGSCVAMLAGTRTKDADMAGRKPSMRRMIAGALLAIVIGVQLLEVNVIAGDAVRRREKEIGRIAAMRQIGETLVDMTADDSLIACVMPNESYAKTLAMGAAYFANQSIDRFRDVRTGDIVDWREYGSLHTLTVESLAEQVGRRRVLLPAMDQDERRMLILLPE